MSTGDQTKLELILHECGIHARRMEHARGVCGSWFPLDGKSCSSLTDNQIAHVDQLIYRYTKLAQLERVHAIADAERRQELWELTNQLAHDYEDDAQTAAGYLNDLYEASASLLAFYEQATRFARERILAV